MTNGRLMSSMRGMPLLILTTTGSKSGKERTIPVMYIRDGKNYVITASNNGWKKNPGWFYNLKASQQAQIEVPGERMQVSASVASPDEHAVLAAAGRQGPVFSEVSRQYRPDHPDGDPHAELVKNRNAHLLTPVYRI